MLGDQPGVVPATVRVLLAARGDAPIAVCRYEDGRGHPFAFGREVFEDLRGLHGDKAVWRMLDERAGEVEEVPVAGRVPLDVDTWADYEAVVARPSGGSDEMTGWTVGLTLGVVVVLVAAAIVITIVRLAAGSPRRPRRPRRRSRWCAARPTELGGIARINDSGVRILHSARALRKVAVGR